MATTSNEQIGEIPLEVKADLDTELVEEFISDAREQLEIIEQNALTLEENAADQEGIHALFRAFHTLKGNAGFLDFAAISQLAHMLESVLDEVRQNRLQISHVTIEIVLKSRDTLKTFIDEIEAQVTGKKPRQIVHIPTAVLKAAMKHMLGGAADPMLIASEMDSEAASAPARTAPMSESTAPQAVKVATSKLDGLVDMSGELLIAQSLVLQNISSPDVNQHVLLRNLEQLTRISKELQRVAMSMRMVPICATFQKLHRLVRDIAAKQDKKVRLILDGEDTEVDRTIVESLSDPLMHMVSNAIVHGIESPERRIARGKDAMGTITLRAGHKSGNIIIEIEDDGTGLDRERILLKARENKMLRPGEVPDDKALFSLILQPGFSTAAAVTSIAGRGVGMDVVQKNIARLRGRIDIKSTPGRGTTFALRLPLTLATIDGLVIRVGAERYILPSLSVRESFHPSACRVTTLPGGDELAEIRHEPIPLLRLRRHFRLEKNAPAENEGVIIVIEADGAKRCLWADELIGKQDVVIKNLGEVFATDSMISGGAILGDGRIGLILDAGALVHLEDTPMEEPAWDRRNHESFLLPASAGSG